MAFTTAQGRRRRGPWIFMAALLLFWGGVGLTGLKVLKLKMEDFSRDPAAVAALLAVLCGWGGLLLSYHADLPTSPVIVLSLGAMYLLSLLLAPHGALRHQRPAASHLQA